MVNFHEWVDERLRGKRLGRRAVGLTNTHEPEVISEVASELMANVAVVEEKRSEVVIRDLRKDHPIVPIERVLEDPKGFMKGELEYRAIVPVPVKDPWELPFGEKEFSGAFGEPFSEFSVFDSATGKRSKSLSSWRNLTDLHIQSLIGMNGVISVTKKGKRVITRVPFEIDFSDERFGLTPKEIIVNELSHIHVPLRSICAIMGCKIKGDVELIEAGIVFELERKQEPGMGDILDDLKGMQHDWNEYYIY